MPRPYYAGATYPERPRAFEVGEQWYEIAAVERQWRTPEGVAFRVRTGAGHSTIRPTTTGRWRPI